MAASQNNADRAPLPQWWWDLTLRQRQTIAIVVLILLVIGAFFAFRAVTGAAAVNEAAAFVDDLPPERVEMWDSLAECESGGDWSANTGNGFYGGLQFTTESWNGVGGVGRPDQYPREEQIMRAEMLEDLQGFEAWPNCSAQLGLT